MSKFFDCLGKQHEKPGIKNEVFVHSVVNIRHKNRRNVEKTDLVKCRKLRQSEIASKYYLNTLASFLSKAAPLRFLPTIFPSGSMRKFCGIL